MVATLGQAAAEDVLGGPMELRHEQDAHSLAAERAPRNHGISWPAEIALVALVYYLAARVGLMLAFQHTNASPVWPPSGIALAVMLLRRWRGAPGVFLGACAANAVVFSSNQAAGPWTIVGASSAIALGNTLEAICGLLLARRWLMTAEFWNRARDVFAFVGLALLMCLTSAAVGSITLGGFGIAPWKLIGQIGLTWWMGDVGGVLVVTPLLLVWRDFPFDWERRRLRAFKKSNILNELTVVRDGAEAVEWLLGKNAGEPPSLVLLDLKLPKIDGLEVLRRLRVDPRTRLIPVVVLTTSNDDPDLKRAYELGCNSYIRKPVDFSQFVSAVGTVGMYWLMLNEAPPKMGSVSSQR